MPALASIGWIEFCISAVFRICIFRYYDLYWATQHLGFLVLGGFTMCTMCCFPANYCDIMHMASLHLGKWVRIESRSYAPPAIVWSKLVVWPPGAFVKHSGELYKACGTVTTAIPANGIHRRFYVSTFYFAIRTWWMSLNYLFRSLILLTYCRCSSRIRPTSISFCRLCNRS